MEINSKTTKAEMEAYIKELEAKLKADSGKTAAVATATTASAQTATPVVNVTVPTNEVTFVYLSNSMGYIKTANVELHMSIYGEEFTVTKSQFDEIAGKYRSWFNRGVLAVSHKNIDIAVAKSLPTDIDNALTKEKLDSVGGMSAAEIENLWNSLTNSNQKHCLVAHVKRKIIDGDPVYMNREKVDVFNRLTDGAFRREQDELSGRYKYYQIDVD